MPAFMTDFLRKSDDEEEEERYTPPAPEEDPLGILSSTLAVVEQGENVWINPHAIEQLSEQWLHEERQGGTLAPPAWDTRYHFHDGTERTINWMLLLDALNF